MIDRKQLKQQAKLAMRQARPAPYWIALLMVAITAVLSALSLNLSGSIDAYRTMAEHAMQGHMVYVEPVARGGVIGWALDLALQIMSSVLGVGFVIYAVRVWRRERASAGSLFDGFGQFFRALWIQILPALLVSLWTLVYMIPVTALIMLTGQVWWLVIGLPLLIPSIVAGYAYSQAVYLMLDNPDVSCFRCVGMSRELMRGHKWELFKLQLSFLGWLLLCVIIPIAGLLLLVWVSVYFQVVCAGYYDTLKAQYMAQNAPPVNDPPQPPVW